MSKVEYFVSNENTLCCLREGQPSYTILAGSVIRGGRSWLDGTFIRTSADTFRTATREDFKAYRVQPPRGLFEGDDAPAHSLCDDGCSCACHAA